MTKSYDQLPDESDNFYKIFRYYLSLGPNRKISELADCIQYSERYLYILAKKYDWKTRCLDYDGHVLNDRVNSNIQEQNALKWQYLENIKFLEQGFNEQMYFMSNRMKSILFKNNYVEDFDIYSSRLRTMMQISNTYLTFISRSEKIMNQLRTSDYSFELDKIEEIDIMNEDFNRMQEELDKLFSKDKNNSENQENSTEITAPTEITEQIEKIDENHENISHEIIEDSTEMTAPTEITEQIEKIDNKKFDESYSLEEITNNNNVIILNIPDDEIYQENLEYEEILV